ncbi:FAD-binding oxidoreductase [Meridianimarinicoccus aquatilis]|uniref:FAD-binding oxidoreductase n=1 Tax=Meridianimarinicoccus aquatilis TaxID=2552766 RepID=A0A4R6B416_9RHOB|nr:FAD-binding oxidoreductase [Fluviibacterium aquatile]TDL91142.1 FAD-binding oxidoreductase [Fluviibacterium aquatile]
MSETLSPHPVVAKLEAVLPKAAFRDMSPGYFEEPRGKYHGRAVTVVAPGNVHEVAETVRVARQLGVGIVPYGGGTGLVGGQVMPDGGPPILLSLERMSRIRAVHPAEGVLICDAGAILQTIQEAAAAHGLLFPLALASQGSCRIGGNLATNAGGVNVLRYGNARDLCLGLEAVLPDGTIWNGLKRLRKDNTGYDLRNLLIGSEGTLGVITGASLRLFPRPTSDAAAFVALESPAAALDLLVQARSELGEGISAFELVARQSFDFLAETMPEVRQPFACAPNWAVLIDIGLHGAHDAAHAMEVFLERAFDAGLITDGVIAANEAQRAAFWSVRESIPDANRRIGSIASHDVSLPLEVLPDFITRAQAAVASLGPLRVNCFGHLGDGNLHFNAFPPSGESRDAYKAMAPQVTRAVHDLVNDMDGSVSAEHGIGRLKVTDLERYGDPAKLAAMRSIKGALDPDGIMNPGAVLRG